eukprot:563453-Prymnesium_polylepis.1
MLAQLLGVSSTRCRCHGCTIFKAVSPHATSTESTATEVGQMLVLDSWQYKGHPAAVTGWTRCTSWARLMSARM